MSTEFIQTIGLTLKLAVSTTAILFVIGLPAAWFLAESEVTVAMATATDAMMAAKRTAVWMTSAETPFF